MTVPDFLAFGDLGVDSIVRVDHLPHADEKLWVDPVGDFPGGMMGNAAVAAAAVGASAGVVALIGDDDRGRLILDGLRERGVETAFVRRIVAPTFWTLSLTTPIGDRSLIQFWTDAFGGDFDGFDRASLSDVRWVHTTAEQGDPVLGLLRDAAVAGAKTSLDVESPFVEREDLPELLAHSDVVFVNEGAASWLGGPADAAAFVHRCSDADAVITLGERGAELHRPSGLVHVLPAIEVDAVDTNGAGDALAGAFAAGVLRGLRPEEAGELAVLVAGLSPSALGGFGPPLDIGKIAGAAKQRGFAWAERL